MKSLFHDWKKKIKNIIDLEIGYVSLLTSIKLQSLKKCELEDVRYLEVNKKSHIYLVKVISYKLRKIIMDL